VRARPARARSPRSCALARARSPPPLFTSARLTPTNPQHLAQTTRLTLSKLLFFPFNKDNIGFMCICHATTLMFCWAAITDHHGFDFTLRLEWIGCDARGGVVDYPRCVMGEEGGGEDL
jgi:hypothetical protein